jgi:hypothetical protein
LLPLVFGDAGKAWPAGAGGMSGLCLQKADALMSFS